MSAFTGSAETGTLNSYHPGMLLHPFQPQLPRRGPGADGPWLDDAAE